MSIEIVNKDTGEVVGAPSVLGGPELFEALALAQARCRLAEKGSRNDYHKYMYASAEEVIRTAKAALDGTGLAFFPVADHVVGNLMTRLFWLTHKSGQVLQKTFTWPIVLGGGDKPKAADKAHATALTSSLKYAFREILAIPYGEPGDDMDHDLNSRREAAEDPAIAEAQLRFAERLERVDKPTRARAEAAVGADVGDLERLTRGIAWLDEQIAAQSREVSRRLMKTPGKATPPDTNTPPKAGAPDTSVPPSGASAAPTPLDRAMALTEAEILARIGMDQVRHAKELAAAPFGVVTPAGEAVCRLLFRLHGESRVRRNLVMITSAWPPTALDVRRLLVDLPPIQETARLGSDLETAFAENQKTGAF